MNGKKVSVLNWLFALSGATSSMQEERPPSESHSKTAYRVTNWPEYEAGPRLGQTLALLINLAALARR